MEAWEKVLGAAAGSALVAGGGYLGFEYLKRKGGLSGLLGQGKACMPGPMTPKEVAAAMGVSLSALQQANPAQTALAQSAAVKAVCLTVPKGGKIPSGWGMK